MMRRMRRSVIANPFLATVAALVVSGAVGCNSCTSCREQDKSATSDDGADEPGGEEDAPAAAGGTGGRELPPGADPAERRRDFIPITVEEVKPLVPPLTGGTFLKEPTAVAGGRRISVHQCVSGNELDDVKAEYEQFLSNQGFKVTPSGRPRKNWHVIRADKENLRISATLRKAEYPDCKESEKKTKVFITYFKRLPPRVPRGQRPGQPGAQPGQPGAQPGQPGQPGAQPGQPQAGQPGAQPGATPPPSQPPATSGPDAGPR